MFGAMTYFDKLSYAAKWLPAFGWQSISRHRPKGRVHLLFALADHFEPAIDPRDGHARAPYLEQQRRMETWCREYPQAVEAWRDHDGNPFVHTYFYPAEQYDRFLIEELAEHCRSGWGEIEIHLHHGIAAPDTADNTRRVLLEFRDCLARRHGCLSYHNNSDRPQYAFVHGNFALANSAGGKFCGVDSEMQVLADTGCYADMTLPAAPGHSAQIAKINSLYECSMPLDRRAPHRKGTNLARGFSPQVFPLIIQGPLVPYFTSFRRPLSVENGSITRSNPLTLRRLQLWKKATITVEGRPDWLFVKLHCHSMDPTQTEAVRGAAMQQFLRELVQGAEERGETIHFVTAREMVNIILAACDGKEGNPNDYRNYRFKLRAPVTGSSNTLREEVRES